MAGWVKDISGFNRLGDSLESPFEELREYVTPVSQFFVCNAGDTQQIDERSWQLRLFGDAAEKECFIDYRQLKAMPQQNVRCYIECAGNHRTLFEKVQGQSIERQSEGDDVKWTLGGVGMAEWRGPRLVDVLTKAKMANDTAWIGPMGLDVENSEGPILVPLPAVKAFHEDTIIALEMNGAPLPADHGFPARLIVPGWIGTYSVKWLKSIQISRNYIPAYRIDEYYVMTTANGEKLYTVTRQNIKSSLALPWPAQLMPGKQPIFGYARAPEALIAKVEWSCDGGNNWQEAVFLSPNERYGWVRFAFDWYAQPGEHKLMTKATDENGETQPMTMPFNTGSLLYNAIIPHPVTVQA